MGLLAKRAARRDEAFFVNLTYRLYLEAAHQFADEGLDGSTHIRLFSINNSDGFLRHRVLDGDSPDAQAPDIF
ncbi:hypothetical protein D3C71_1873250 [compost metagenome]